MKGQWNYYEHNFELSTVNLDYFELLEGKEGANILFYVNYVMTICVRTLLLSEQL